MLATGSARLDAERAFTREQRARRRDRVARRLLARSRGDDGLPIYDAPAGAAAGVARSAEIPLDAIAGTVEPNRSTQFDRAFRPAAVARERWQRIWLAEHRGVPLPPITVVRAGGAYAVHDGHHRVSVARARGALTIDAMITGPPTAGGA